MCAWSKKIILVYPRYLLEARHDHCRNMFWKVSISSGIPGRYSSQWREEYFYFFPHSPSYYFYHNFKSHPGWYASSQEANTLFFPLFYPSPCRTKPESFNPWPGFSSHDPIIVLKFRPAAKPQPHLRRWFPALLVLGSFHRFHWGWGWWHSLISCTYTHRSISWYFPPLGRPFVYPPEIFSSSYSCRWAHPSPQIWGGVHWRYSQLHNFYFDCWRWPPPCTWGVEPSSCWHVGWWLEGCCRSRGWDRLVLWSSILRLRWSITCFKYKFILKWLIKNESFWFYQSESSPFKQIWFEDSKASTVDQPSSPIQKFITWFTLFVWAKIQER